MALHNAYAIEVAILITGLVTLGYIGWMVRDTWQDYLNAVTERHPPAWQITGLGRVISELWRFLQTVLLVWIGAYMVTHPPPVVAGAFFSVDQFAQGRVLLLLLTLMKGAASFTDRWYRRRARIANGIRNP